MKPQDAVQQVPLYLGKLITQIALPKWLISLTLGSLDYFLPTVAPSVFVATFGLIVLDTCTGILRAYATKQEVTSAKLGRFLIKLCTYSFAICTIALALHAVPKIGELHGAVITIVLTGIAMTETYSNLENLKAIGYELPAPVKEMLTRGFESILPKEKPSAE